jgi:hypothetical protein
MRCLTPARAKKPMLHNKNGFSRQFLPINPKNSQNVTRELNLFSKVV